MCLGSQPMFLVNPRTSDYIPEPKEDIKVLELLNFDVDLPKFDDTLYWCRIFKINEFLDKSQLIKVRNKKPPPTEPLF